MARGRFITFEGGEGSGKSTHVQRLAAGLREAGLTVVTTREPGGTPEAEAVRALLVEGAPERWDPVTETLLHFAARRQHVVEKIWPALERGAWVVCDRFADSTVAYQGRGHELGADMVKSVQHLVIGGFLPDLTLILDIPVDEGLARAGRRHAAGAGAETETRYERMSKAFHERTRTGFLEIAKAEPGRCILIDTAQPLEAVARAIDAAVAERLGVALPEPA